MSLTNNLALRVIIHDPDSRTLSVSLGIEAERFKEMQDIMKNTFLEMNGKNNNSRIIAALSEQMENVNELVMMVYMYSVMLHQMLEQGHLTAHTTQIELESNDE